MSTLPLYCEYCGRIRMHTVYEQHAQCTQCNTRRPLVADHQPPKEVKPNEPQ